MPLVREKLREIEAALRGHVALARLTLGTLLGEKRVRVYADGRIEGLAMLAPLKRSRPRGDALWERAARTGEPGGVCR